MKKLYIVFLLNFLTWNSFCEPVEFSSAVYFTVPAGKDNKTVKDNSKLKYNYGLRLNFPSATITGNAKLASTEFKDIGTYTFNDYISKQEYTYGINQSLKAGKIKFNISAGTLHYSGAISRLKKIDNVFFIMSLPYFIPVDYIPITAISQWIKTLTGSAGVIKKRVITRKQKRKQQQRQS